MIAQYIYIIIRTQEQDQDETEESDGHRIDDWMLICQHNAEFGQATGEEEDCDWSLAARAYPELRELPSYIAQQRQEYVAQCALTTTAVTFRESSSKLTQLCVTIQCAVSRTELSDLGSIAVVLDRVMRQAGQDAGQERFRNLLLRLRNAELTVEDWKYLMTRTTGEVGDTKSFDDALRLYPTIEAVAEHNVAKLRASGQPIAVLRAVHTGPGASKATSDDAGGLEPVISIAHGARVMLSANLWVEVGLVNGALGTVEAICYEGDQQPPNLPIAVTVKFDSYSGPTLPDGTVPITPLRRTWFTTTKPCSRLQIPLKLAWAVTIH